MNLTRMVFCPLVSNLIKSQWPQILFPIVKPRVSIIIERKRLRHQRNEKPEMQSAGNGIKPTKCAQNQRVKKSWQGKKNWFFVLIIQKKTLSL